MTVDLTHPDRPDTPPELSGAEMKDIRKKLGLTTTQMGRALGYEGRDESVAMYVRRYESGGRDIPRWIGRLLVMFERHGVPAEFLEYDAPV